MRNYRTLALLGLAICVTAMLTAIFWFQKHLNLEPCPLCIFQRVAMIASGIVFLVAALHAPRGGGRWSYAVLLLLTTGIGAFIAGRHVWLQSLPEDQRPACGPTLDYLIDIMPLREVVSTVIKGDGNCAKIDWSLLGLSIPGWTLVVFLALALLAAIMPILARSPSRYGEFR